MTTQKQALSTRKSGNVAAGQRRSAELRQCPSCNRKAALTFDRATLPADVLYGCRWCGWAKMIAAVAAAVEAVGPTP